MVRRETKREEREGGKDREGWKGVWRVEGR